MKVGDLVKMKYDMWWKLRSRKHFVTDVATVIDVPSYNTIQVLLPDGSVKRGLVENWQAIA